ncbi:hypothetical protein BKK80_35100 (plasmid) [Cupriavidus malaysiensis]|uniref:Uncharacterized protein n=1 Tax=Cupriavidus malaysiensis TaxID=367825 RepID=A0ABN4TW68_9BURK|nr:hypothetical protein BKK80_35100 [Cupriavidus malaysiensis]
MSERRHADRALEAFLTRFRARPGTEEAGESGRPVDVATPTVAEPQPSTELLAYRAQVLEFALVRFVTGSTFDAFPLDDTALAVGGALGRDCEPHKKTPAQLAIGPALQTLQFRRFDEMPASVRQGLPAAILEYIGVDATSGTALLGESAWLRVAAAYEALAATPSRSVPEGLRLAVRRVLRF